MAARKTLWQTDQARLKIQTTQLIKRLTAHALGEIELQATQVRSIEVLLKKVLPDLSHVTGDLNHTHEPIDLTDEQLATIAAGRGEAASGAADGEAETSIVH